MSAETAPKIDAGWLQEFNTRQANWLAGNGNPPLGGRFFRCQIPKAKYRGKDVDPRVIAMIHSLNTRFEIIYDKFMAIGGKAGNGPAFMLCTRRFDGTNADGDVLVMECPIQLELLDDKNLHWGHGTPVVPTVGFTMRWLPLLTKAYIGPMWKAVGAKKRIVAESRIRHREYFSKKRAEANKTEIAGWAEILPYLDSSRTKLGRSRTLRRTAGRTIDGKHETHRVMVPFIRKAEKK